MNPVFLVTCIIKSKMREKVLAPGWNRLEGYSDSHEIMYFR